MEALRLLAIIGPVRPGHLSDLTNLLGWEQSEVTTRRLDGFVARDRGTRMDRDADTLVVVDTPHAKTVKGEPGGINRAHAAN